MSRDRAAQVVKEGVIRWSAEKGLSGGFVYDSGKRIEERSVAPLIALFQLRAEGLIGVDEITGDVWWVNQ